MAEIRGWRKMTNIHAEGLTRYMHTNGETLMSIEKIGAWYQAYFSKWIISNDGTGWWKTKNINLPHYKTKTEALRFAKSWMRRHPHG